MLGRERVVRLAALAGLIAVCVADARADGPSAPSGWQMVDIQDAVFLYRPIDGDGRVEVRLYAGVGSLEPLQAWFERRVLTPPPDVEVTTFGPAKTTPHGYLAALAEGRRISSGDPATAAVMACEGADGNKYYAELVVPPEPALARPSVAKVAEIVVIACSAAAAVTAEVLDDRPQTVATTASAASWPPAY